MNCLIENEYIRELSLQKKTAYVFPNELPSWKRILKGKKRKKTGKKSWRTLLRGGFIIVNRELAYFIAGGFINAMWTLYNHECRKDDEVAVPVCAPEHERYCPIQPHPTGNWSWKSSACVCTRAEERYCPTPPHR